jgi:hypothetical protein
MVERRIRSRHVARSRFRIRGWVQCDADRVVGCGEHAGVRCFGRSGATHGGRPDARSSATAETVVSSWREAAAPPTLTAESRVFDDRADIDFAEPKRAGDTVIREAFSEGPHGSGRVPASHGGGSTRAHAIATLTGSPTGRRTRKSGKSRPQGRVPSLRQLGSTRRETRAPLQVCSLPL